MIKKVKGGYKAATSKGKPLSKKKKSYQNALKQLKAVKASQARRGKK